MFFKRRRTTALSRNVLSAGLIATAACTNVIVPPRDPLQPRPIFVVDHGQHASLVLPASDSVLVRFAYGDWKYYARAETGVGEASAAVLLPTAAGLGRRALAEPATEDGVRSALRVGVEGVYEVIVDSAAAGRLLEVLDSMFDAERKSLIYNRGYDLEFVRHPRSYTIFRNSNWMVADWLRQLGCRVSGLLLFSKWKLDAPSPPAVAGERDPAAVPRKPGLTRRLERDRDRVQGRLPAGPADLPPRDNSLADQPGRASGAGGSSRPRREQVSLEVGPVQLVERGALLGHHFLPP